MNREHEWSVYIQAAHDLGVENARKVVEVALEHLKPFSAVTGFGPRTVDVQMSVDAESPGSAVVKATRAFLTAFVRAKVPTQLEIVAVEAEDAERLDERLKQPDVPDLIGIAELAQILNVSKQRASQLARQRDFPVPYVRLASGPIWKKSNLSLFLEGWMRRPGPKPKQSVSPGSRNHATSTGFVTLPLAAKDRG